MLRNKNLAGLTKLTLRLATLVLLLVGTAVAQTKYTVTDLGTLGGTFGFAAGINDKGWVSGLSTLPRDQKVHATLWVPGLKPIDLGTLGGPNSINGFPLNEKGQVAGWAETSTPDPNGEDACGFGTQLICLPFLWRNGVMTALPLLGGNNGSATEVNNRGQVAGGSETASPDLTCPPGFFFLEFLPAVWENAEVQELPTFPGDPDGWALAINDNGQAAGFSGNCTTLSHALLWENGTAIDLGNLGGTALNLATDINNQGQVIGHSGLPGNTTQHPFLWQNGVMTDLGTLPGDVSGEASGINSKSQIVGGSCDINGNCRAFLWENGLMIDLNTLIPASSPLFLVFGSTINDQADIAGFAMQASTGEIHAFLATPIPVDAANGDAAPAARGEIRQRPRVTLPENVRRLLERHLGFGRLGIGLPGPR